MKHIRSTSRRGFTLVEMLAVITIIVILAGLVVGGAKFANDKRDSSKAKIQIALISKALEEYKLDHGAYPPSTSPTGENETSELRKLLYLDGTNDEEKTTKIYIGDLNTTSKQGWVIDDGETGTILDPWQNEYRYRTGPGASNPDFDLWSMGKDSQTDPDDPKASISADDIRN